MCSLTREGRPTDDNSQTACNGPTRALLPEARSSERAGLPWPTLRCRLSSYSWTSSGGIDVLKIRQLQAFVGVVRAQNFILILLAVSSKWKQRKGGRGTNITTRTTNWNEPCIVP